MQIGPVHKIRPTIFDRIYVNKNQNISKSKINVFKSFNILYFIELTSAVAHGPFCSRPAAYFLKNAVIERPQFTKMGVIRCICFTGMGIIRFKYINI